MRLDKFLKNSRIIKRRTVAREACDLGNVSVNGNVAKAGTQLEVGDVIVVTFGQRELEVRVLNLDDNPGKDKAQSMYEVIDTSEM